jgi:hypothetical protein
VRLSSQAGHHARSVAIAAAGPQTSDDKPEIIVVEGLKAQAFGCKDRHDVRTAR